VKQLPVADPGTPDTRSPVRFLLWVGRRQLGTLALGMTFGIIWMLAQALLPWVLGRAVDGGLATGDTATLLAWSAVLFGLGIVQAVAGTFRHRVAVSNWLQSAYRMIQLVAHHVALTGPAVRARLTTGEVVATVSNDALRAGGAFDITARLAGAVASYFVVAIVLLSTSTLLGVVVLLGVPALVASLSLVIRPLQARQREQREEVGRLTALRADTVAGLRVLRGIGGERVFLDRYRKRSEEVRLAGVRVALPQSTLDSAQVLLPGIFIVVVTWLGARLALEGKISAGELVAFYGYAAFLVIPLRVAAEAVDKIARALVGAQRMLAILRIDPLVTEPESAAEPPPEGVPLLDERSGLVVEPGLLTCVLTRSSD
jgi:ABC-type multidrug transport system fused ATPase/permease subunit